ncbi:MAG: hypothetical protein C4321_07830, partial [Chloroflexota bacterium]
LPILFEDVHLAAVDKPAGLAVHGAPDDRAPSVAAWWLARLGDATRGFDVDRPGTPVLVKVSYFPNWQASGARGPWRVTPNFMVVVPTSTHVELHYGRTPVDWLGLLASAAGI